MSKLRAFRYSGSKLKYVDVFNSMIDTSLDTYCEPFLGSGALLLNLNYEFKVNICNDIDSNIIKMFEAIKKYEYKEYMYSCNMIKNQFGDIKNSKDAYYNFRNFYNANIANTEYSGLYLLHLANSCINSMLRFSKDNVSVNQSFGHRYYVINENDYNMIKNIMQTTYTYNKDYYEVAQNLHKSVIFVDPPYMLRQMSYSDNFNDLHKLVDLLIHLKDDNQIIYTDASNNISDKLLDYGFKKEKIRDILNTCPYKHSEKSAEEVVYYNYRRDV